MTRSRIPVFLLAFVVATPLAATTLIRLSFERIVSASDAIVEGRVRSTRSFWEGKQIQTEVTLEVTRTLKGKASPTLSFRQLGGSVAAPVPITLTLPGAPAHSVGDRGFYFLSPGLAGHHEIVGLSQGRVLEQEDDLGAYVVFHGLRRTPGEFADDIRRVLAGQSADATGRGAR